MKVAGLRKSILQAAVQGKLVPQDLHDEPASVLFERIRAEKVRLVKEGKIKKEKPLPPITEDEIPYDLPEGWIWCRLGDVFYVRSSRRVHQSDWRSSGIPFYRAREIAKLADDGFVNNDLFIDPELYAQFKNECGVPQEGDLMVTAVGTLGKTYIVKSSDIFYYKDASVICFCNFYQLDSLYFKYLMASPIMLSQINSDSYGTTVSTLTIVRANNFIIPLPPLAEQRRIVTKVNELMTLCDELEAVEQKLDALERRFEEYLPKSILQAAVQGKLMSQDIHNEPALVLLERIRAEKVRLIKEGKIKKENPLPPIMEDEIPYDLPVGWVWCRLSDIISGYGFINDGDWIESKDQDENGEIRLIQLADVGDGKFIDKSRRFLSKEKAQELKCTFLHKDDILIARMPKPIGRACLFPFDESEKYVTAVDICIVRHNSPIYNNYLIYALNSPVFRKQINEKIKGATRKRISTGNLKSLLIPIPPLDEQLHIVTKVDELMALCEEIKVVKSKPIERRDSNNVIDFLAVKRDENLQLAARGGIGKKPSSELMQVIDEMFTEDE